MRQALLQAVKVIKQWHGEEVFEIYYNNAPEMGLIRNQLGSYDSIKDEPIEVNSVSVDDIEAATSDHSCPPNRPDGL